MTVSEYRSLLNSKRVERMIALEQDLATIEKLKAFDVYYYCTHPILQTQFESSINLFAAQIKDVYLPSDDIYTYLYQPLANEYLKTTKRRYRGSRE